MNKMDYYIGLDIGTSSTKAVLFLPNAEVVTQCNQPYAMNHPAAGQAEQDALAIWEAVQQCLFKVLQQVPATATQVGVSLSAAMHSLLLVDAAGQPINPLLIWADNRAAAIARSLKNTELAAKLYTQTGLPLQPYNFLLKLRWLQENEPQLMQEAAYILDIKSFIWWKFTGQFATDLSMASGMGLLNKNTRQWDEVALAYAQLSEAKLPAIVPMWHQEVIRHPLFQSYPFKVVGCIGGGDGPLASIGSGAMHSGKMALSIGTSGAVRVALPQPFEDASQRTFTFVLDEDTYVAGGASNNGAVVLQWLREDIFRTEESLESLVEAAFALPNGSEGLVFLPYILGERAPIYQAEARGVFFGLSKQHTQANLMRAAIEGITFNLFTIAQLFLQRMPIDEILVSGGFAQQSAWLQLVADVFQRPVTACQTTENSAWGAVVVMQNEGLRKEPKRLQTYEPTEAARQIYAKKYAHFLSIYDRLSTAFD